MTTLNVSQTLTKLSYIVLFPPGEQILPNGELKHNADIAMEALKLLIDGGGIVLPTGCGWAVQIVNNDTGEVTTIGTLE